MPAVKTKDKLAMLGGHALAASRPAWLTEEKITGLDHIGADDMEMPRLAVAQLTSKQILKGHELYIQGLEFGQYFNSVTGEVYGEGALTFSVLRADPPRAIEFTPIDEGGGVVDMDVPLDDSRLDFTVDGDGKKQKPVATKFYDFIIMLWPTKEIIALSFKSSGLRVAKKLNFLMRQRSGPPWVGVYSLKAVQKTDAKGTYAIHVLDNHENGWVNDEQRSIAKDASDGLANKKVKIHDEREPGDDDEPYDLHGTQ
jgi:hypothetical protein